MHALKHSLRTVRHLPESVGIPVCRHITTFCSLTYAPKKVTACTRAHTECPRLEQMTRVSGEHT